MYKRQIIPCDNYNELTVDRCITRAVDALGGVDAFVPPKAQVVLKPNLCLAEPFDKHVTTHPQVVRSIMTVSYTHLTYYRCSLMRDAMWQYNVIIEIKRRILAEVPNDADTHSN